MKVVLMMAQSADGIIAKHNRHFPDWTCPADKKLFKQVTQRAGVLIMGSRTYQTIGKPLPGRLNVVYTRQPDKFEHKENLMTTSLAPAELLAMLAQRGYNEVILTGGATINSLFAAENLIDEILLTVSPILFGKGLSLFDMPYEKTLRLLDLKRLDPDTVLMHYRIG